MKRAGIWAVTVLGAVLGSGYVVLAMSGQAWAAAPTATITVADTSLAIGETSSVSISFSETVLGFTTSDLTVENGTVSGLSSSDGGVNWTATLTPTNGVQDPTNRITLDNSGVRDLLGTPGVGTTTSNNYVVDTVRPTVSVGLSDSSLGVGETSVVTFGFSEAVSGFTSGDLSVANGSVSGLSSSDGGVTWTGTLTPSNGVEDATNVLTVDLTGVVDAVGNVGSGSASSANYVVDTVRPTTTSVSVADTALAAGETSVVTIGFSEAVSGLTSGDLTVANGSVSGLATSDGGITWTGTLTPAVDVEDASNVVTLDNTGVVDAVGNTGSGTTTSNNYAIDTLRPTAVIAVADPVLTAGETSPVTVTFSEPITGLTLGDLTAPNATLSGLSSSDGGTTWTATLTPAADVTDTTNAVSLDNTGVQDAIGNAGIGVTTSGNYEVRTAAAPAPFAPPPTPPQDAPSAGGVTPRVVDPGDTVTVVEGGFAPGETVHLVLYSAPVALGTTTADGTGAIATTVVVPQGTSAGAHTLVLYGQATSKQAALTVLGAAPDAGPSAAGAAASVGTLTATGAASSIPLTMLGLVLVSGGMALVLMSRRRLDVRLPAPAHAARPGRAGRRSRS